MLRRMIYVVLVMMLGLIPMNLVYGYERGSPDLLAWWTFDEGTGLVVGDASGNGNDGILVDGPTFVDGQFGQALAFEESRVAISASDSLSADLFQGPFTLSAWINPTQTGYMWQQIFRSIRADDASNDTLFINNGGKLSWRGRVGGAWANRMCETAPDVVRADQWTHVAVTGDGTHFRIYVNGALSQESNFQTTDGTNAIYYIGGDPTRFRDSYIGMIDDVRIYNMALTGLEILFAMEGVEQVDITAPGSVNIILVTEVIDWDMDGLRDDHSLESFLVSEGYNVDVRPDYWKVLTPGKIAELNAADLIIFSRLAWSDRYDDGNETSDWNSLTTPLLQMNSHFAQNTRWKWVNSGIRTPEDTTYIDAMAVAPYHPVFRGVPLTAPNPIDRVDSTPLNVIQMIDPLVGTGLTSFIGSTDMGNGQLIAKPVWFEMGWIAEWDAGVEFFEGSGQYAGGKRMLFCAGTQEIQYYDYDRQEVITTAQGELNLTAEGIQMFRNAIDYLLNIDLTSVTDGHVYLFENVGGNVPDDSVNSHTANLIGSPQVVDGLKGKALQFNGTSDGVHILDGPMVNLSTQQNRTVVAIFKCSDVTKPEKQVVYEEGGTARGLNIYVHEGLVYTGGWNLSDYTPEWTGTYLSAPISSNVWHAVAMVVRDGGAGQEDDKFEMWMDGELISKGPGAELRPRTDDCGIGYHNSQVKFHDGNVISTGSYFEGIVDEIWMINAALTQVELSDFACEVWPYAFGPTPADGSKYVSPNVELSWSPGDGAQLHIVYFGDNFDDVNNDPGGILQETTTYTPGTLELDKVYYWRVDEFDGVVIHKGDVWSFTVADPVSEALDSGSHTLE